MFQNNISAEQYVSQPLNAKKPNRECIYLHVKRNICTEKVRQPFQNSTSHYFIQVTTRNYRMLHTMKNNSYKKCVTNKKVKLKFTLKRIMECVIAVTVVIWYA